VPSPPIILEFTPLICNADCAMQQKEIYMLAITPGTVNIFLLNNIVISQHNTIFRKNKAACFD
jgi:hypothetical protein